MGGYILHQNLTLLGSAVSEPAPLSQRVLLIVIELTRGSTGMNAKGLTSLSAWCLWFDASADSSILDTKLKSEFCACSDCGSWGWHHCGIYGCDPLGFSSLWFLPSELHQQVGHSVRQKKITTYFPFLDMSWLGIKSLARDTGPGDTQGSPAHTVAQSHLDPSLSSTTLQGQLLLSLCSGMTKAPWSMGSTLPGLELDSFEWLISVSSAGFQGMTDAGSGGGGWLPLAQWQRGLLLLWAPNNFELKMHKTFHSTDTESRLQQI